MIIWTAALLFICESAGSVLETQRTTEESVLEFLVVHDERVCRCDGSFRAIAILDCPNTLACPPIRPDRYSIV